jgi:UDP-hydrolysing UDP-N-acetyl-D-glucosamine 2-epimerase
MQTGSDDPGDQAIGLGRGIAGIARFLAEHDTDIVLVLGDRIEAFAGAAAAYTSGRIVAHSHGGDVAPGDLDDSLRHSITKLAHIHLPASEDAARRIIRMGEDRDRVHVVGAPGLDRLFELRANRVPRRNGTALVVQHATGRSRARESRTMTSILRCVRSLGLDATVIYPNSDRGHSGIIEAIDRAGDGFPRGRFSVRRSLPRDEYLGLLLSARVLVGNSSSGIIEAGAAGTPAVNIGRRQQGRLRNGGHVIDCDESAAGIRAGLERALRVRPGRPGPCPYGTGGAGRRIAEILAKVPLRADLYTKLIAY